MTNPQGDFPDFIQPAHSIYTTLIDTDIGGAGTFTSVGQFTSLHVILYNQDHTSVLSATYEFTNSDTSLTIEQGLLSCDNTDSNNGNPTWTLPVVADTFAISGLGAATRVKVIGTSQVVHKRLGSDLAPIRTFTGTLAANAAAGTTVNLLSPAGLSRDEVPVNNCSNYNGEIMMQWRSTVGITGDIFVLWIDSTGTEQSLIVAQNFSTTIARLLTGHPYGFVKWKFVSNALNGGVASVLTLALIPATAPL